MSTRGVYGFIVNNEHYLTYQHGGMYPFGYQAALAADAADIAEAGGWERARQRVENEIEYLVYTDFDMSNELLHKTASLHPHPEFLSTLPGPDDAWTDMHRAQVGMYMVPAQRMDWEPSKTTTGWLSRPSFTEWLNMPAVEVTAVDDINRDTVDNIRYAVVADLDRNELVFSCYDLDSDWVTPYRSVSLDDVDGLRETAALLHNSDINNYGLEAHRGLESYCGATPTSLSSRGIRPGAYRRRPVWCEPLSPAFRAWADQDDDTLDDLTVGVDNFDAEATGVQPAGTKRRAKLTAAQRKKIIDLKATQRYSNAEIAHKMGPGVEEWDVQPLTAGMPGKKLPAAKR